MNCVYCGREHLAGQASLGDRSRQSFCDCINNPPSEYLLLWNILNRVSVLEKRVMKLQAGTKDE